MSCSATEGNAMRRYVTYCSALRRICTHLHSTVLRHITSPSPRHTTFHLITPPCATLHHNIIA
eukprot:7042330-Alexandrium_andersonii.AAC.1